MGRVWCLGCMSQVSICVVEHLEVCGGRLC